MEYKVAECFVSINGEGQHAGELAAFVRFVGCNLNCNYCDTAWANQPDASYKLMTEQEIVQFVRDSQVYNVTLTGGEPLLREGLQELLGALAAVPGLRIEIETNGSVNIRTFINGEIRPCFTLDYKLPGSGMESYMLSENYQYLLPQDTVKFVVSDRNDLERAKEIIDTYELQGRCGIYLSPVFGRIEPVEIVQYMLEQNLNQVHVQLQLHKFIWDPNEKGV